MKENIEKIIESRIKEVKESSNPARSTRKHISGEEKNLIVIKMPVDLVTLNPNNHRIAAQREGLTEDSSDPRSQDFQAIIESLLADTDDFSKLVQEIKERGQVVEGLITRDGLLIDGNTRCVALRKLQKDGINVNETSHIDVAVLPPNFPEKDLLDIELEQQMVKLTHQDYTFTNRLKFMDVCIKRGYSDKELAKKMLWQRGGQKKVQISMRMLSIIEEVRKMSKPPLAWEIFDTKKEHLKNLDDEMQKLIKEGDVAGAENLKYCRVLGILMGANKDQIREVDTHFLRDIKYNIGEDSTLAKFLDKFKSTPDEDFSDEESDESINGGKLLGEFLNSEGVVGRSGQINLSALDNDLEELRVNIETETDRRVQQGREKSRGQELSVTMRGIRISIEDIKSKLAERIESSAFKPGDFTFEIKKAKKELNQLMEEYSKLKG